LHGSACGSGGQGGEGDRCHATLDSDRGSTAVQGGGTKQWPKSAQPSKQEQSWEHRGFEWLREPHHCRICKSRSCTLEPTIPKNGVKIPIMKRRESKRKISHNGWISSRTTNSEIWPLTTVGRVFSLAHLASNVCMGPYDVGGQYQ